MPKTPPEKAGGVHTPAQTAPASKKPPHHEPTAPRPRDKHTGLGGSYVRDPVTGERRRATPDTDPKEPTP